jgi:transposase
MKEKKPAGRPAKHPIEFQMMVAKKVRFEGMTYREASKIFNVSSGCVSTWVRRYGKGIGPFPKGPKKETESSAVARLETHVKELKGEIAELYLANLMLKKAIKFAVEKKKPDSSVITSENLDQYQEGAE